MLDHAKAEITDNARRVLEARYLCRDKQGQVIEAPEEMFRRVAHHLAQVELNFGGRQAAGEWEERFYDALVRLDFLPNSPTLMNAGLPLGQLSACFVLPVGDSMEEIFDALKHMALIQQSGGGTGFSFSRLRPKGDVVSSTSGRSSGPVSFMRIFDCATENVRQGGKRRGANMGILRVDHPDIREFIEAKLDGQSFRNFNLSVGATDEFMKAAHDRRTLALHHPRSSQTTQTVPADELFAEMAQAAWRTGDPGLIFLDAINRANPTPEVGQIEATNPCGEVPLLSFEACNLASINLSHMVRDEGANAVIDWDKLADLVKVTMRFLDNVIDASRWPVPETAEIARANRKVGLGVMGFAEMLILLGIPYDSNRAVAVAEELMRFLAEKARAASQELAHERGVFPNWPKSIHARHHLRLRNTTCTSIAPTGTLSIIAGTSAGIEPLFALAYRRHVLDGQTLVDVNPLFVRHARQQGFYSERLMQQLQEKGSLTSLIDVPAAAKTLFPTALDIAPEAHLCIQAAFQKYVDNAVSKTINLPETATPNDIAAIYRRAWEMGLKGITVFRYGSKGQQVLELGSEETPEEHEHFVRCDPQSCRL